MSEKKRKNKSRSCPFSASPPSLSSCNDDDEFTLAALPLTRGVRTPRRFTFRRVHLASRVRLWKARTDPSCSFFSRLGCHGGWEARRKSTERSNRRFAGNWMLLFRAIFSHATSPFLLPSFPICRSFLSRCLSLLLSLTLFCTINWTPWPKDRNDFSRTGNWPS